MMPDYIFHNAKRVYSDALKDIRAAYEFNQRELRLHVGYLQELPAELRKLSSLRVLILFNFASGSTSQILPLSGGYVDPPQLSDISSVGNLTHLVEFTASEFPQLSDIRPLAGLSQLVVLNLSRCAVSDLSPLARLTQLASLNLSECSAVSDVSVLGNLKKLTKLYLGGCSRISDVSVLAALANLTTLDLNWCNKLRSFFTIRSLLGRLADLRLYRCNFTDLPSGVCGSSSDDNVIDEVRAYYADLDAGAQADAEVKLFILGNGGVGKTQLRHRLCDPDYELDPSIPTTHGVELDQFATELDDKRTDVRVNLWDFGGQDIYHGTHALFLDGHAVFVILWHSDFEHGEFVQGGVRMTNRPLAYWLDYVRAQAGPDAVVLLVQARADARANEYPLPAVDLGGLRVRTLAVSSLTGRGLDILRAQLKEAVRDLLDSRPPYQIGVGRAKVRDRLREWLAEDQKSPPADGPRRTFTKEKFAAVCAEIGGVSSSDALLSFLHRSGVVFYRPGLFGEQIVLDQQWALNAIYTVFNRDDVLPSLCNNGEFTRSTLARLVWQRYSVADQELFLGMMRECDICFQIGEQQTRDGAEPLYRAPELLPDDRDTVRKILGGRVPKSEPTVTAVAKFAFLHDGVLRSVLALLGRKFGDLATYWKWGCYLYDEAADCRTTLEAARGGPDDGPGGGTITVRVWADKPDSVLTAITEIVNRAAGRQEPKWSTTSAAKRSGEPEFVVSRRNESAPQLTPGIPPDDEAVVAISYGHGDDSDDKGRNRGAFVDGLEAALRGWGYRALRDVNELRDGGLIREFVPTLVQRPDGRPRRIVLVLSEKYLRSPYCMAELHAVWQLSLSNRAAFARSVVPCVVETDLGIDDWRGRKRWIEHWKNEYAEMSAAAQDLSADDKLLWHQIALWQANVGDMLTFVSNMVTERGYAKLTADGFAAVKRMLARGGS